MPELPEVEVVKLYLQDKLLNHQITQLEILNKKSFIGDPKHVKGQTITKFSRIGKQLSLHLSNGLILLIHLKMTGQLVLGDVMLGHPTKVINPKSIRIIFHFNQASLRETSATKQSVLYFNDQRKFGWVQLFTPEKLKVFQSRLGRDIFDPDFTPKYLYNQLQRSSRAVKLVLLDQNFFAGIGNIYANDALFLSGIHPQIPANQITPSQAKKIHHHLISIMRQSVLAGGSTAKDKKYIRPDGSAGGNQFFFRVYQRAGEPCLKCRTPVKRIVLGGRGTFLCPKCQPAPAIQKH